MEKKVQYTIKDGEISTVYHYSLRMGGKAKYIMKD